MCLVLLFIASGVRRGKDQCDQVVAVNGQSVYSYLEPMWYLCRVAIESQCGSYVEPMWQLSRANVVPMQSRMWQLTQRQWCVYGSLRGPVSPASWTACREKFRSSTPLASLLPGSCSTHQQTALSSSLLQGHCAMRGTPKGGASHFASINILCSQGNKGSRFAEKLYSFNSVHIKPAHPSYHWKSFMHVLVKRHAEITLHTVRRKLSRGHKINAETNLWQAVKLQNL